MVKKSEINKKGRLAKSTLSVVLAASMVLTSSSFVWAAPVEDIAIVEEGDAVVEAVEAPVEEAAGASVDEVSEASVEENVKAVATKVTAEVVSGQDLTYNGKEIRPTLEVKATSTEYGSEQTVDPTEYEVTYSKNIDAGQADFTVSFPVGSKYYGTDAKTGNFTITPMPLTDANTKVNYKPHSGFVYNGAEQSPEVASVVVTTKDGKITLASSDYELKANTGTSDLKSAGVDKEVGVSIINENYTVSGNTLLGIAQYDIDKSPFNKNTVTVESKPVAYTGNPVAADVIVKNNAGDILTAGTDYTIAYYDADGNAANGPQTNMRTYKIQIKSVTPDTGKNYIAGGAVDSTYTITKGTLALAAEKATLTGTTKDPKTNEYYMTYNGSEQSVSAVTIPGLTLNKDFEVDLTAAKGTDVGSFDVTIQGMNDYAGQTVTIPVVIRPMPILADEIETAHSSGKFVYTAVLGKTQSGVYADSAILTLTRYVDGTPANDVVLKEGTDYTYTTDKSKEKVVITGMGNYTTVNPTNAKVTTAVKDYTKSDNIRLEGSNITGSVSGTYAYTGEKITPPAANITVMDNGVKLVKGTDYTISYGDNKNAGEGTVIITGVRGSKYEGTKTLTFEITGIAVDSKFKIAEIEDIPYATALATSGAGKVVPTIVYIASGALAKDVCDMSKIKYFRDGKQITADSDFVKVGTIDIEVPGKGEYVGTLKASYKIVGDDIATVAKVADIEDQAFTGNALEPEVKVTLTADGKLLKKGTDYNVKYDKNTEVGTAYVTVSGMGSYSGEIVKSFKIVGTDISKATVTVDGTYTYTGKAIVPTVTVKLGDKVIDAASYDVTATDNTNAGTAKVTVTGKGGCTGTTEAVEFTIAKADQKLAVSKATADALKIRNTNANTYTLKVTGAGTTLSYTSSNTNVASVSSTGKLSFKHVCGKATITVTAAADDNHNAATLDVAVAVKPATPKITVTARAKGFNAKATTVKDITGYQVGYSTDKNFAASKTKKKLVKTTKALNKNFSGLSAKKGYYVRVRAYKKVGSTVYWGNWTSAKKITTK